MSATGQSTLCAECRKRAGIALLKNVDGGHHWVCGPCLGWEAS